MENSSTHKTEVCGSSPQWPTKSAVLEELPIRELLIMLLGEERRRKMGNKTKTNDQLGHRRLSTTTDRYIKYKVSDIQDERGRIGI